MTQPPETPPVVTPPAGNPDVEELARLRKEKADADAAAAKAKDDELAELRTFKENASKAPIVTPPVKKADKPADTPPVTPPAATTKKRRGRSGASRLWFGDEDE